jgi:hypothetical protein
MRGTYTTYTQYDLSVVGLVDTPGANPAALVTYVDATANNTTRTSGAGAWATGPGAGPGATDNLWHRRTGFGNGGEVFTADEVGTEDAPTLRMTAGVAAGTYDVYAYFWADKDEDWEVRAGLSSTELSVFSKTSAQHVDLASLEGATLTEATGGDLLLYQAYLGRMDVAAGGSLQVYIDDGVGSVTSRTWFDGIGYAAVPEPASIMLPVAAAALALRRRRVR